MSIRIVVDSACDVPPAIAEHFGISVVPIYINIGDQSFRDGVDITRQEFYDKLSNHNLYPSTATPSPELFHQVYKRLENEGATQILSIHISTSLSMVVEAAQKAAAEMSRVPVTVIDSRQLSLGSGFLAITAAEAARVGASMTEILDSINQQIKRTHVFAALDTLEYLKRSGRMNGVMSFLGNLLQIKPILRMFDGKPFSEKVRTRRKAISRLISILESLGPLEKIALMHSTTQEKADDFVKQISGYLEGMDLFRSEICPTLGAHIGPGVIGLVCITRS